METCPPALFKAVSLPCRPWQEAAGCDSTGSSSFGCMLCKAAQQSICQQRTEGSIRDAVHSCYWLTQLGEEKGELGLLPGISLLMQTRHHCHWRPRWHRDLNHAHKTINRSCRC